MNKYNFSNHEEIMQAITSYFNDFKGEETDKTEKSKEKEEIIGAVKDFLRTRTNSELMDLFYLESSTGIHINDTGDLYYHLAEEEWEIRCIPYSKDVLYVLNEIHPNWAYSDTSLRKRFEKMEKQVEGMQKKIDKIVRLIEGFQITMSVADALKL